MKPLDLREAPPRGPREMLLGFYLLARTVDKLRAELPGGHLGDYRNDEAGFSAYVVRRLGLRMHDLRVVVAQAQTEADVVAWLSERVDVQLAPALNAKLESFVIERMSAADQVLVRLRHPVLEHRPELSQILDVLDADDRHVFGSHLPARDASTTARQEP